MNIAQITNAVTSGTPVYWSSTNYKIIKDSKGQFLIECQSNGHCIGLTYLDGKTLNGKESDFYTI